MTTIKLAIYGKGGIGKSTIAANLSAALAMDGRRVLQIGCDPKHDSTRLLLAGRTVTTALDYLRRTAPAEQSLNDLLHTGYGGVVCAEAGGPEPGVGCAGRGILSTFALFERLGLDTEDFDVVVYDVLGDVVCGGFAVPLRKGYADAVVVVASEEFMAIYAANNILKGVHNFDGDGPRLAGVLLNSRGIDEDSRPVERFAQATKAPIIGRIPRSDRFRQAEKTHRTVVEAFPGTPEADLFHNLARRLTQNPARVPAQPLDDGDLERIVLSGDGPGAIEGAAVTRSASPAVQAAPATSTVIAKGGGTAALLSKSMLFREPLHGCAFTGAISITTQVRDAVTVAHGPRSCGHIAMRTILASGTRTRRHGGGVLPRQLAPALVCSDMNEETAVYGGGDRLRQTLKRVLAEKPSVVFVVNACPPGVIGDDLKAIIRDVAGDFSHIPILPITADGNIRGDFMQGVLNACTEGAATLIEPAITPAGDRINILAEKNIANNAESNFKIVADLLASLGIRVNCRFAVETGYTAERRDEDLIDIRPDLFLCNYVPERLPVAVHADGIPFCPDVGFRGGVTLARRWATLLKAPIREGWRDDGSNDV